MIEHLALKSCERKIDALMQEHQYWAEQGHKAEQQLKSSVTALFLSPGGLAGLTAAGGLTELLREKMDVSWWVLLKRFL
ncbi:hypothetical protein [Parendozoicomonas haliclonae]|uniref:Uncharacterized protein n=1 Tax=Parendozoicomonas haliclonae TaxID=1960125 RepID=A0A1X7ALY1_9GAMM|nr:hypothetical protein [Parendozoicomonas haliclonae]SMA49100.1 hypothetical protein EHSB41UT_03050 [Parendozoicomonas haliclonae]